MIDTGIRYVSIVEIACWNDFKMSYYLTLWLRWYSGFTKTIIFLLLNKMYLRNDDGCYIHESEFTQYIPEFTLKNLKKLNQIKLGNLYSARKMPDTIKCFKKEWEWYKVPGWISGYLTSKFTSLYNNEVIEHPELLRLSYDHQEYAIQATLTGDVPWITDGKDPESWTKYTIITNMWKVFNWVHDETIIEQPRFDIQYTKWLIHASTWSGKTQIICSLTNRLKRNTLILVQNLSQMSQMVDDIWVILGVIPTQVSGEKPSKKEQSTWYPYITVCSIDSRDKVNPRDYWLVLADEVDTFLGSDDRRDWVGSISPEYLYWLTGTIKINHVDDKVFKLYLWPTTTLKIHHLTPDYVQVPTQFSYILEDMKDFHELKEALYTSQERNSIIMDIVTNRCKWRKWIVFCEYVEHARYLYDNLRSRWIRCYLLIGEVSKEDRERIRQEAKEYQGDVCLIGSVKILWRGFDLDQLSYWILTTSEKFESSIQQYIWRIIRKNASKPHPIFYDLVDQFQYLLSNQSKKRVATFKKEFPTGKVSIL